LPSKPKIEVKDENKLNNEGSNYTTPNGFSSPNGLKSE